MSTTEPAEVDEHGLPFTARIEPHGSWTTELHVRTAILGPGGRPLEPRSTAADGARREMLDDLDAGSPRRRA